MNKLRLMLTSIAASLLLSMSAWAATAQISFSDPSAVLGSEINVKMKVKSSDAMLSRADISLSYDSTALEFISGTDAEGGAGAIRVHGAGTGAGTGTLEFNLKFNTLSAGQGEVRISTQEVYDTDEAIVEITHNGSSTVSISNTAAASTNAALRELTISPGELSPAFTESNTSYELTVGEDVNNLAINAIPADEGASVSISGNEALNMGENSISITVTAADGSTKAVYRLRVIKQEGVPATGDVHTATTNEGVRLTSKEKTITIMNPGSDVEVPVGFAESTIDIDGRQVRGWVWKADEKHEYCIVYGMNDAGDLSFYRYDLTEKTLQRYFSDPIEQSLRRNAEEYPELLDSYNKLAERYNIQLIITIALAVISLLLAAFSADLLRRSRSSKSAANGRDSLMDEPVGSAGLTRPAANRGGISLEDLEATRAIADIPRKTAIYNEPEEDLEATKAIPAASRLAAEIEDLDIDEMELTKVLPVAEDKSGLEIEEL